MSQLSMRRAHLRDLPQLPALPPDYALREMRRGEETAVAAILHNAFGTEWTSGRVCATLVRDPHVKAIFVATWRDRPVAVASARTMPAFPHTGFLHYVGVDARHRGHRLGAAVSLCVLHFFRDAGFAEAALLTDDFRLAAIKTYFMLGFEPEFCDDTHEERWRHVRQQLAESTFAARGATEPLP